MLFYFHLVVLIALSNFIVCQDVGFDYMVLTRIIIANATYKCIINANQINPLEQL